MRDHPSGDPPDPTTASTPAQFTDRLQALRLWAGQPSLRRLRQLGGMRTTTDGGAEIDALPESTMSYVLRGDRPARAEFVRWFVTACLRVRQRDAGEISGQVERWHRAWLTAVAPAAAGVTAPEPTTTAVATAPAGAGPVSPVPRQLPAGIADFVGRATELAALDRLLPPAGAPLLVAAITGQAGVGKSALAIHWAHRVADRFPDGQLHVNLRGFEPGRPPMEPDVAVRGFLEALEVPPGRVPADPEAQVGLYRSQLAGRRMLLVLDNARDAAQVRPLLPGTAGCLVLVTSRNPLGSLVATDGARPVTLDLLPRRDARELLARRLGPARLAAEPAAADELITRCARLPLALAVVAARAAARPELPVGELARQLREARPGLDGWSDPDPAIDVRAAFEVSYRTLADDARQLFRALALHPGPDVSVPAAASLLGTDPHLSRKLLTELAGAHLIEEHATQRYRFHDLLRAFATELAATEDPAPARQQATLRLLDCYLHNAYAAVTTLNPNRLRIALDPSSSPEPPASFDEDGALAWFIRECPVLLAMIPYAAGAGLDRHCWRLAWALSDFLQRRGRWDDWHRTQRTALAAARRWGDLSAQGFSHRIIAGAQMFRQDYADAQHHLLQALARYGELGDRVRQARIHNDLSVFLNEQGRHQEGLVHARRSAELCQAEGDLVGQGIALNGVGWLHAQLGNYRRALDYCRQALALQQQTGERYRQSATWDSLGHIHHHLGQHHQAAACLRRAIRLARDSGEPHLQAMALDHLGDVHYATGAVRAARRAWRRALPVLDRLGPQQADQVRAKLNRA